MTKITSKLKFLMLIAKAGAVAGRKFSGQGLGFGDLAVLYAISQAPEGKIRRTDLADEVGLTASGVTRLLIPLEKIGVVKRQAHERDARASYVVMTKSGKELFENALKLAEMRSHDLISEEQAKKLDQINELLENVAR